MSHSVRVAAIIPARLASGRFPGKPLLDIRGLPMVEHVRRRSVLCRKFTDVVVATCDREIASVVERFGGRVVMTSAAHPGATDRVAEAATHLDCTHVVNVQGDEILVLPEHLERMAEAIEAAPNEQAWNALGRIGSLGELSDPSIVKCVVSLAGRVLYCARNFPPMIAGDHLQGPVRKVLGLLGFHRAFLARYPAMPRTPLELQEGIDQSRIIEHDIVLQGVELPVGYPGINEPRDVALVERYLDEDPAQQAVLREIFASSMEQSVS